MKKVLVVHYSQSGQLSTMVDNVISDLKTSDKICLDYQRIKPKKPFSYPWSFYPFFDIFPETIALDGCEVEELNTKHEEYDLIILGYTVWFLAPSLPISGFLKTAQAKVLFKDTPVITLIACRDMWIMAQEKMKSLLNDLEATLIDNVVLTDQGGSFYAFITTPRWLFTGRKTPFLGFPSAGVSEEDLDKAKRFSPVIKKALELDSEKKKEPLLQKMGAVVVNGKLLFAEKIGTRSFFIWAKLIRATGKPGSFGRKISISVYVAFLVMLILSIVPLNVLLQKLLYPLRKKSIAKKVAYYEQPSGQ